MPNDEALFQQILAHPADDTPRLVYADFLEEQGNPRAEFIRLQCELAKMSPFDDRWSESVARERRLRYEHGKQWGIDNAVVERGFISTLNQYQPIAIAEWGKEVFGTFPIEHAWFFTQEEEGWGKGFAECEFLQNLKTLWIGGRSAAMEFFDLKDMLASPHLANLETFCLTGDSMEGLTTKTFPELINAGGKLPPGLQNLKALSVELWVNEVIDAAGLQAILDSDLSSTLTCLSLDGQDSISQNAVKSLLASSLWERLTQLDWGFLRRVPDGFAEAWSRSHMERLRVHTSQDQFAKLFLNADHLNTGHWGRLTHLNLIECEISLDDFAQFVAHPAFAALQDLCLGQSNFNEEHVRLLANSPQSSGLRALYLNPRNPMGDAEDPLIPLSKSPHCQQLCELTIYDVSAAGIQAMIDSNNFANLHTLSFRANDLTKCLETLAEAKNLPRLTNLSFHPGDEDFGETAFRKLLSAPVAENLTYLNIFDPQTPGALNALQNAEQIVWLNCYVHGEELRRKCRHIPNLICTPTPRMFPWKPPM